MMLIGVLGLQCRLPNQTSPGIKRTELQRRDLSAAGREMIQVRIDFGPYEKFGKHSHPGEEIIYVLEGLLEYEVEGMPTAVLEPGGVLFIPAGVIHSAKNIGSGKASELATYIIEKGKPLISLATQ
jgi:quercetin dioxygenase-like cupin family protein